MKVAMFVFNPVSRDTRVLKEAKTLIENGADVTIFGVRGRDDLPEEEIEGIKIERIKVRSPIVDSVRWLFRFLYYRCFVRSCRFMSRVKKKTISLFRRTLRFGYYCAWRIARIIYSHVYSIIYSVPREEVNFRRSASSNEANAQKIFVAEVESQVIPIQQIAVKPKNRGVLFRGLHYISRRIYRLFHYPPRLMYFWILMTIRSWNRSFDVFHCHDCNTLPIGGLARLFSWRQTSVVYDSHELFLELKGLVGIEKFMYKFLEPFLIRRVDQVITVNGSIAQELVKRYSIKEPEIVMNCPENPEGEVKKGGRLYELLPSSVDKETPVVLYQGGFSINRGLEILLDSYPFIEEKCYLVYMGWGALEGYLKETIIKRELTDKVFVVPPAPLKDLIHFSSSAAVGVIPYQNSSMNNYLCTPNKLFEYLMSETPVAASRFPELEKVVEGLRVGELFNETDPKDIGRAITKLLRQVNTDPNIFSRIRDAKGRYCWGNEGKNLLRAYGALKTQTDFSFVRV